MLLELVRVDLPVIVLHKDAETIYFLNVVGGDVVHCTCPDFEKHRNYCKHSLFAQDLLERLEEAAVIGDVDAAETTRGCDYSDGPLSPNGARW